jgi:hypothetical protein
VGAPPPALAQDPAQESKKVVKIMFPKDGDTFTLAAAAKGVKLEYKIVVQEDYKGVIPLPFGPSFREPAGASGLFPREEITGTGQRYCLLDFGLAQPPKETATTLKKGTHVHAFEWDGRNWLGPSDTGNPKGKAFPAGTYDVIVTVQGKLVTGKGKIPCEIKGKTKLVLK